jgi:uncharacterized RDD family membrane protein YckC
VSDLATAALWRRGAAAVVDVSIGALIWLWSAMCVVVSVWGFRETPLELPDAALLFSAVVALGVALHVVYHVAFVGGCGQTPGRMALGIAVVRRDGGTAGYGRALLRCLGGSISFFTLGVAGVGMLLTRERRGFADWMAGTRVVRRAVGR